MDHQESAHEKWQFGQHVISSNTGEAATEPPAETELTEAFPKFAELNSARAHFADVKYGATTNYHRPFSRQLKDEIFSAFPIDHEYYRMANWAQTKVCLQYIVLRLLTITIFVVVLTFQVAGTAIDVGGQTEVGFLRNALTEMKKLIGPFASSNLFIYVTTVGLIGFVLRTAIRFVLFNWIMERAAERLSHQIFKKISIITDEVRDACSKARDRTGKGGPWPKRANAWIVIALWNAKRAEYLDRFSTAVIWCVQTYTKNIEIVTFWLKVGLTGILVGLVKLDIAVVAFLFAQVFFFWHRLGQKPRNFWTLAFRKSAEDIEEDADNYPSKIGAVVENLVDEVLGGEFGSAGRTAPKRG
jgi:hypothetical protein